MEVLGREIEVAGAELLDHPRDLVDRCPPARRPPASPVHDSLCPVRHEPRALAPVQQGHTVSRSPLPKDTARLWPDVPKSAPGARSFQLLVQPGKWSRSA